MVTWKFWQTRRVGRVVIVARGRVPQHRVTLGIAHVAGENPLPADVAPPPGVSTTPADHLQSARTLPAPCERCPVRHQESTSTPWQEHLPTGVDASAEGKSLPQGACGVCLDDPLWTCNPIIDLQCISARMRLRWSGLTLDRESGVCALAKATPGPDSIVEHMATAPGLTQTRRSDQLGTGAWCRDKPFPAKGAAAVGHRCGVATSDPLEGPFSWVSAVH